MDCEKCKNYEEKEQDGFQEAATAVDRVLRDYCGIKDCEKCAMGMMRMPCIWTQIQDLLEKAGWKK